MNKGKQTEFKMTKEQKEAYLELQEITKLDKQEKIKKWRKRIIKIAIFIILYKLIFGTIDIKWPFGNQFNRWYTVTINNTPITVETTEETTIPLIPFFVNWKMYSYETFYNANNYEVTHQLNLKESNQLDIKLKTYECYASREDVKNRALCTSSMPNTIKKEKEIKIDSIYIRKTDKKTRREKDIYNGPMISNLINMLEENSEYYIEITAHYSLTESKIVLFLDTGDPNYIWDENWNNQDVKDEQE